MSIFRVEEVDPRLRMALSLAQFSTQYLTSCQSVLKQKQDTLQSAIRTFEDEEELLDLELAKYRFGNPVGSS